MTAVRISVEDAGRITARLLIRAVHEACLVEQTVDSYLTIAKEHGARLDIKTRKLQDIDLRRIEFELLAFGGYLVARAVSRNIKLFQRHYPLPNQDHTYLDHFGTELADYFRMIATDQLKEIVVTKITPELVFGEGPELNVFRRFEQYSKLSGGDGRDMLRYFGESLWRVVDPPNYAILGVPVGVPFANPLIDMADWAFRTGLEDA